MLKQDMPTLCNEVGCEQPAGGSTGLMDERSAKQRLDELRESLFAFQGELVEAKAEDLSFVAERARGSEPPP